MEREFPVPGFTNYFVTAEGQVISYCGKTRRVLKQSVAKKRGKTRDYIYVKLQIPGENRKKTISLPRLMLAAKLGRWLEPWEQARHKDGDCNNNHIDNLLPGCVINNMLDDIENGTRETNAENIDLAIERLIGLRRSIYK